MTNYVCVCKVVFDSRIRNRASALISQLDMLVKLAVNRKTLSNSNFSIEMGTNLFEPFNIVGGFEQDYPLSNILFNFVMESVRQKDGSALQRHYFPKVSYYLLSLMTLTP